MSFKFKINHWVLIATFIFISTSSFAGVEVSFYEVENRASYLAQGETAPASFAPGAGF